MTLYILVIVKLLFVSICWVDKCLFTDDLNVVVLTLLKDVIGL